MSENSKTKDKNRLHAKNRNREAYDLEALKQVESELSQFITLNKYGTESVDFANTNAVKLLNKALLNHYYGIKNWDFPDENLCPPIPGRADYLHYIADLLTQSNFGKTPIGNKIKGIDIGVGASCIYPIIGYIEYGWQFLGVDINEKSLESAEKIVNSNPILDHQIKFKLQGNPKSIFRGIINPDDRYDFTMCNPPFHSSEEEAIKGSQRKIANLSGKKMNNPTLNFAGINKELIYEGGEIEFIERMIRQSKTFAKNCFWFTTLVSKESNVKKITKLWSQLEVVESKIIPMGTGNKTTRIVAWTFLSKQEQLHWKNTNWKV